MDSKQEIIELVPKEENEKCEKQETETTTSFIRAKFILILVA